MAGSFFKNLDKLMSNIKDWHLLLFLGLLVLAYVMYEYNIRHNTTLNNFAPIPGAIAEDDSHHESSSLDDTSCHHNTPVTTDPGHLLPEGSSSIRNFETVRSVASSVIRNANLQLRLDPPIPPIVHRNFEDMSCICIAQPDIRENETGPGLKVC